MKHALSKSKSERNCWFTFHKFKAPGCCLPLHKVGVGGDKLEFKEIVGRLLTCTESQHYLWGFYEYNYYHFKKEKSRLTHTCAVSAQILAR